VAPQVVDGAWTVTAGWLGYHIVFTVSSLVGGLHDERFAANLFLLPCRLSNNHAGSGLVTLESAKHESLQGTALALAKLIVETLNLDVDPVTINPQAPLFGEGLGLDSIDMLEIALATSQTYGVKLRSDDADNVRIFSSLASLDEYIQQNRA
jgi:acyl carrier protein